MITLREMKIEDYNEIIELWEHTEGMWLSEADSLPHIQTYLERNPYCSFIAEEQVDNQTTVLAGTLLAGHDGRRGYMYHLAVDPAYRGQRIATQLIEKAMKGLTDAGIDKCHIFVMATNVEGQQFWVANGWEKRDSFYVFSKDVPQH
ncbi:GNAT family N-acetyltransferase [Paenibacillus kyungheensis]